MSTAIFSDPTVSVTDVIRSVLVKLENVGNSILANANELTVDEEANAKLVLADISKKTVLLEEAIPVVAQIDREAAIAMTHDLVSASLAVYSHFEE